MELGEGWTREGSGRGDEGGDGVGWLEGDAERVDGDEGRVWARRDLGGRGAVGSAEDNLCCSLAYSCLRKHSCVSVEGEGEPWKRSACFDLFPPPERALSQPSFCQTALQDELLDAPAIQKVRLPSRLTGHSARCWLKENRDEVALGDRRRAELDWHHLPRWLKYKNSWQRGLSASNACSSPKLTPFLPSSSSSPAWLPGLLPPSVRRQRALVCVARMTSSTIVQTLARVSPPPERDKVQHAFLSDAPRSSQPFTDFSNLVRPLLHSERGISSEQGISSERARAIHQARRQSRGVGSADLDREDASEEEPLAKGDVEEEEGNVRVASASQPDASTTPAPKHLAEPASSKSAFSSSTYATASQSPSPSDSRPPWPFHSPSLSSLPNPFHHRPSSASSSLTDATSSRIPTPTPLTPTKKEHLRLSAIERQQHNPSPDLIETCPTPPSSGFRPASRQRNLLPSRFVKDDGGAGSFEEDSVESSDEEKQEELFLEDGDGENEWMREDYSSPDTPPLQFLASSLLTAAYDRPLPTNQRFPFHRHSNYASTPISTVHSRTSETTLFTYDLGASSLSLSNRRTLTFPVTQPTFPHLELLANDGIAFVPLRWSYQPAGSVADATPECTATLLVRSSDERRQNRRGGSRGSRAVFCEAGGRI